MLGLAGLQVQHVEIDDTTTVVHLTTSAIPMRHGARHVRSHPVVGPSSG
jgi:hypothetical protein